MKNERSYESRGLFGRKLGERTVSATRDGHLEAITWSARWAECQFALEDCRHVTRLLEADLLAAGRAVVRVPPQLMAGARRGGRERGKSDPIDALAVARAALREPTAFGRVVRDPTGDVCFVASQLLTWCCDDPLNPVSTPAPPTASC